MDLHRDDGNRTHREPKTPKKPKELGKYRLFLRGGGQGKPWTYTVLVNLGVLRKQGYEMVRIERILRRAEGKRCLFLPRFEPQIVLVGFKFVVYVDFANFAAEYSG